MLECTFSGAISAVSTQDQAHINDVGAQCITDCQAGIALPGRDRGYQYLRCRGADADDGQADDEGRYLEVKGNGTGADDKAVCTPGQQGKTAGNRQ